MTNNKDALEALERLSELAWMYCDLRDEGDLFSVDTETIRAALEKPSVEWQDLKTIPLETTVILGGNGKVRFGYLDKHGQWRKLHHRPMNAIPTKWMEIPT